MIIRPKYVYDKNGKRWFRPGISYIHQSMLGISREFLKEAADKNLGIEVPDEVWNKIKNKEFEFISFKDGDVEGVRVVWKKD